MDRTNEIVAAAIAGEEAVFRPVPYAPGCNHCAARFSRLATSGHNCLMRE
jgi:hypothetical protein